MRKHWPQILLARMHLFLSVYDLTQNASVTVVRAAKEFIVD